MSRIRNCASYVVVVAALLLSAAAVQAQGVLVNTKDGESVRLPRIMPPHPLPRPGPPPASYKIGEISVEARLIDTVAQVQVSQSFVNTGSTVLETSFMFPLPYDGAIDQLTLMVDGKELPGKLLDRDEARRIYEAIVRKNRDPALLEWMGTGMFQTSVFPIPPGATRTVTLRYSQICRQDHGLTDFLFPLSTAKYSLKPVERVHFRVTIESANEIKNVYSPTHAVQVKRTGRHATVLYDAKDEVPTSDFRLFFDAGSGNLAARVLSYRPNDQDEGYFLLLASPQIKAATDRPNPKTVLLVVDRSGSMSGKKIEQTREAAKFVLNNLNEGDLFNVIAYDSVVENFRSELQRYDEKTRQEALGFVESIYAGGSTNIDGALTAALAQLQDHSRPSYVLFLTDGLPTVGESNEMKIVENARKHNQHRARIIAFGVGYDLNSRLLDKLVRENFGQSEYVRPNEDIEEHVSRMYAKMRSPVLTDVQVNIDVEGMAQHGKPINRVYPREVFDLFEGEQLVLAGRYKQPGAAKVTVSGNVGGSPQKFDFPGELVAKSKDESHAFVAKLWAGRRIGEILDELDLKGKNQELIKELVELSKRHGILTPYTSFLADERTGLHDLAGNQRTADEKVETLMREAEGVSGVAQRASKEAFRKQNLPTASVPGAFGGGGEPARLAAQSQGNAVYNDAKTDKPVVVESVRQIGNRAFYRRNQQWVDSTVSETQEKNARRIKQFTPEYFKLAADNAGDTLFLAFDEPVMVNLRGEAYLIEPAE